MKNKKAAAYLCTGLLLLMAAGCGDSDAYSDVPKVEVETINSGDADELNRDIDDSVSNGQNYEETDNNHQGSDEPIDNNLQNDKENDMENDNSIKQDGGEESGSGYQSDSEESSVNQPQAASELNGIVESIGDNGIVINKVFNVSSNLAVVYGDDKKVLVTVFFSEETRFEVWAVKNGGIGGDSDVVKRGGSFSDIKEQLSVILTGSYEGEDFHATQVIIYNFA